MIKYYWVFLLFISSCSYSLNEYDARIADDEILTPLPGQSPVINGPTVYGARPDRSFLYRIPCQGVRPITFHIEGLPEGLYINNEGILYGKTPRKKGIYSLKISAVNTFGSVTRPFRLVVGDKIALTPPTGWNSWGGYMLCISDSLMRSVADFFVEKGLADVGFQYLGMDDCWMRISNQMYKNLPQQNLERHKGFDYSQVIGNVRDQEGNILPNDFFPDMKGMVDYIHSKGLKVGIYSTPGVATCQGWAGSLNHEAQDAKQYADWGIDLLKYDLCSGGKKLQEKRKSDPTFTQADFWKPMATYIQNQNRDIVFNLCQYGNEKPWEWAPQLGIQSWRCTKDLNHHVENYFQSALRLATELSSYAKPGQWNDPDFMYIHFIRDAKKMFSDCIEIPLNTNQRYQYVTLWSMICAPYIFSCNIEKMDEFTLRLLSNTNLMNINQDALGQVANVIRNTKEEVVMLKELEDGRKALAIFNLNNESEKTITVNWTEIGEYQKINVFDAWRMKELGQFKEKIVTKLSANGVALYLLNCC